MRTKVTIVKEDEVHTYHYPDSIPCQRESRHDEAALSPVLGMTGPMRVIALREGEREHSPKDKTSDC